MQSRWLAVVVAACSHPVAPHAFDRDLDQDQRVREPPGDAAPSQDLVAARSVVFLANIPVRAEPTAQSARIGIVGRDAHAKAVQTRPPVDGCTKRWVEIVPRGWVCESNLAASDDPPSEATTVPLDDDNPPELGSYGWVNAASAWVYDDRADAEANGGHAPDGSMLVRKADTAIVRGDRYWIGGDGSFVGENAISPISSSSFRGAVLTGELRVAWTHRQGRPGGEVATRAAPRGNAPITGHLPPRSQVTIAETSPDGRFVRVDDGGWIARADLRMPSLQALPPGVAAQERWFDVDLDEQVLVAYEGTRPVYATLVSTGRSDHPTPPALSRVAHKHRTTTMVNSNADSAYSVADVPWTMFYADTLALHGAYWHDGFGDLHSHGCVNLAPRDARVLYAWSAPTVPPGWTAVFTDATTPGSLVRVHGGR